MPVHILQKEIARHDWKGLECGGDRSTAHGPEDFLSALRGPQSNLMEPAFAAAAVLTASLVDRDVPQSWRRRVLSIS
jgi:hypothetical protein